MKKLFKAIALVVCALISALSLTACASGAPEYDTSGATYAIEPSSLSAELENFMEGREDRTTYTAGEAAAAEYILTSLTDMGYGDAEIMEFSVLEEVGSSKGTVTHTSQNVRAIYRASEETDKNVIIGAYYDNAYSMIRSSYYKTTVATNGALSNGTGTATLLSIARYFAENKPSLEFNVTFAFFGAGAINTTGSQHYYNHMTAKEREGTVLMIELQRLGVDHVYAFADEHETAREGFFDRIAKESKLDIYKTSLYSPQITSAYTLDGVPFYKWAHGGMLSVFYNNGIPTLNVIGANWETIDITDEESEVNPAITLTAKDTLSNFTAMYHDYAIKLAQASTLVINAVTDPEFYATMKSDRDNFPDTSVLTTHWIWYLIVFAIIAVATVVMTIVNSRLSKKYPVTPVKPKNIKMAVFGMDYEDKDPDSIYIDIRDTAGDSTIFDGVPDNDPFPEYGSAPVKPSMPAAPEPFDGDGIFVRVDENDKKDAEEISKASDEKPIDPFGLSDGETSDENGDTAAEPDKEKENKKPKRSNVSAGKSSRTKKQDGENKDE